MLSATLVLQENMLSYSTFTKIKKSKAMKSILLIGAMLLSINLFSQVVHDGVFKYNKVANQTTKQSAFQLLFVHDGKEHEIEDFVSTKEFVELKKSEFQDYDIPATAIVAVYVEFENGMNGTVLVAYCIKKGDKLMVFGKASTYPNFDEEVFTFQQKLSL